MNACALNAVAGFVVVWCVTLALTALASGWHGLARHYRAQRSFGGARWHLQQARLRYGVGYNGCLTIGADRFGLYLSVLAPFRAFHPPLYLPWSELHAEAGKSWFVPVVRITPRKVPTVSIVLSERLAGKLRGAAAAAMADERALSAAGL